MRSIKPGRGPSLLSGLGALAATLFGVFWTVTAAESGAPILFPLFGIVFIGLGAFTAVYHLRNAAAQNRSSIVDIVDENEEPDPLNRRFGEKRFCPYCGEALPENARFCPGCGREIDER